MLRLNDDCLCHIFAQLDCREQLMLTAVCERFRDIIVAVLWRSRFRRFVTTGSSETDVLSCQEFQSLFELIVHSIEHLVITDPQQVTYTSYLTRYTWRPELAFYLSFEFPVLRVLECHDMRLHDSHVRLLAAHCPLIERLHVVSPYVTGEHIAGMRHLRVLQASGCSLRASYLQQILATLPVIELSIAENCRDEPHVLAEALMSASSDLRDLWIVFGSNTPALMRHMVALASPSKRRHPLTVHIDNHEELRHLQSYHDFSMSLQRTDPNGKQSSNPTHTVSLSELSIKYRFFSQSYMN